MLKIFNTQLSGIFKKIDAQEEELEIAARLLAQAPAGEGTIYIKGFGDLRFFESFAVESKEALPAAQIYISDSVLDKTDRVLIMADDYDEAVVEYIEELDAKDIDYVLVCNKNDAITSMNFIDLSTPRAIIPTEDFSRIITPHFMAMNYIYYAIYANMRELLEDL